MGVAVMTQPDFMQVRDELGSTLQSAVRIRVT